MAPKSFHTFNLLFITFTVVVCGYVFTTPISPIKSETKRALGYRKDYLLNFTELTGKYGYISDEHRVTTEDGYILTIFRIVSAKKCNGKKKTPPVLLMHGLLLSSDAFIDSGPTSGIAYLIADGCYDLWVGNYRGNYYSRNHVRLDPDRDAEFWQFDGEHFGKYDLPALMDYILDSTGSEKLNYIGFSQGVGMYVVMCSERPEYCNKARLLIALAPASRQMNTESVLFRTLTESFAAFESDLLKHGMAEAFPKGGMSQEFLAFYCQISDSTDRVCERIMNILDHVGKFHTGSRTHKTIKTLFGHFPAGTSVRNMASFGQSMKTKDFRKHSFGREKNLEVYGSVDPPAYNVSATTVPVMCLYGKNDGLIDSRDVKWLMSNMPNVLEVVEVKDPLWTHLDMLYSKTTGEDIMPKINEYLSSYSWT